ncbi:hypothetical protein T45_06893 [Streptomyces turgidiscabies]|nr:hypothetical protein T45_06893 [Streptomyces turgidiscabies]
MTGTCTGTCFARSVPAWMSESHDPSRSNLRTGRTRLAGTRHSRSAPVAVKARHSGTPRNSRSARTSWPAAQDLDRRPTRVTCTLRQPASSASSTAWLPTSARTAILTWTKALRFVPRPLPGRPKAARLASVSETSQPVPSDGRQPQAPPERARRRLIGHRLRGRREQHLERFETEPLPGSEQRRLRRNMPVAQQPQPPQTCHQMPHGLEIGSRREQRQPQDEVHDQPRRKQPPALL